MTVTPVGVASVAELAGRYTAVAAAGYPGAALRWGEFGHGLAPVAPDRLARDLRALLGALPPTASDHHVVALRRALSSRLFELDGLSAWRTDPQFYVDRRGVGMLNMVMLYEKLQPGSVPRAWCRQLLAWFPGLVEAARRHLDPAEMARVDVSTALERLRAGRPVLEQSVIPCFSPPAGEATGALEALDELEAFLDGLARSATAGRRPAPLTRPVGVETLAEGLRIRTGIGVDLGGLERRCLPLVRAVALGPAEPVPTDAGALAGFADEIARFAGPAFECATPEVEIRPLPPALAGVISSAAYHEGLHGAAPVVVVNPAGYPSLTDLRLDLVHEAIPGHHWQRRAFRRRHGRHAACPLVEDHAFVEGWARWCEHWYAERAPVPDAPARFASRLAKYAGQAVAAMRIHGRGRPLAEVGGDLASACGWPRRRGIAVAVSAYLDPWAAITPVLGYLALRRWSEEHGEQALCRQIADHGRIELGDVDVMTGV